MKKQVKSTVVKGLINKLTREMKNSKTGIDNIFLYYTSPISYM